MYFDFAFSFAGEDRDIVDNIAKCLKEKNYSVFYDLDFQHELLGQDLYSFLRDIYKNKGKFVVCFLSNHYKQKIWTRLEMSAIKERLIDTFFADDFLIPIFLDSSIFEDIPTFLGYYKFNSVQETVELLDKKFNTSLREDVLFENITMFIKYLCTQIVQQLQTKNVNAFLETSQSICITHSNKLLRFEFICDTICYIPFIMIQHGSKYPNNLLHLPDLLITWDKEGGLKFTVYNFNTFNCDFIHNHSFNELIQILSDNIYKSCC